MRHRLPLVLLAALFVGPGCTTIRTGSDFDDTVDFSRYDRWVFAEAIPEPTGRPRPGQPVSPLDNERIRRAIADYLESRGIPESSREEADVEITYHLGFEEGVCITSGHSVNPYGYYYSYPRARRETKGTLVIDVIDRERQQIVWHGYAYKTIYERATNPDDEVRRAVEAILGRYPN